MLIDFSPIRNDGALSVSRYGQVLVIDGREFDLSRLGRGDRLPRGAVSSDMLASDIVRDDVGVIRATLLLPHGPDAAKDVRFPEPVALDDGACIAPGLVPFEGETSPGLIDWSQLITAAQAAAEVRADWRAGRVISKPDLLLALYRAGVISEVSAMGLAVPAEFEKAVAVLPDPPRAEIRIRWAHLVEVPRMHPLILTVQAALQWPDEAVDVLFGWED